MIHRPVGGAGRRTGTSALRTHCLLWPCPTDTHGFALGTRGPGVHVEARQSQTGPVPKVEKKRRTRRIRRRARLDTRGVAITPA